MDDNVEHLIIETVPASQRIGYVILRGLCENRYSIELKRIVITEKNQGQRDAPDGQEALF